MPTENVLNRNFGDLFKSQVRYEIPFFQRGYAWEQRQWKKLFEDINLEIIETVSNSKFEDEEHFFGPIVVLEKISHNPSLKRFLVIDGQQRITTIYLLLSVIKKLIDAKAHLSSDAEKYSNELDLIIRNTVTSGNDDYLNLKVFSTKGDRLPTYKSVFGQNPNSPFLAEDQLLYNPEENGIDSFVKFANKYLKNYDVPQLWEYYQAITKSLKIVWIPLDEKKDDPQAIFESLNDAGMPLSSSELLCNYIFRPLTNDQTNEHEKLHNEKWLTSRRAVGEENFEEYLRDLFSIGEKKRVGKDRRMYVHFKIKNKKISIDQAKNTLNKIIDYTKVYNQISHPIKYPHSVSEIKKVLINIKDTNITSIYPFLMELLKSYEHGKISDIETTQLLQETYVLIVRRKISNLPITKYDTFFPALLGQIVNEPDKTKAFQTAIQSEGLWVADQLFEEAFLNKEIYNNRELNFSRLVLQEIDRKMQLHREFPDYSTINTIEHILPQTLDDHWKAHLGADAKDINLPMTINTIGNLSLHSQGANSSLGQLPFKEKQKLLSPLSALARDIKERRNDPWNILAIQQRAKDLAKIGLQVWKWNL